MDIYTLAKIVEQIEEATIQIDKSTATGSRLALILIDNALELTMWQEIKEMCSCRDPRETIKSTKMYDKFCKKTQFLVSNYIVTDKTKIFLMNVTNIEMRCIIRT